MPTSNPCGGFFAVALFVTHFGASAAAFTVTDLTDNAADPGSIRFAINNLASGSNTINFANGLSGTITLTNGPLAVQQNLTINGPGANVLTIDAQQQSRV